MPPTDVALDNRGYLEILNEALARIPVHNPEWTNFTNSDPGVTLLQLFAFMTDALLFRANQIPERNRAKFLQLLGVPLRPGAAAEGVVAFSNERGPIQTVTLRENFPVSAGPVGFVTRNALDVLPVEGRAYYRGELKALERAQAEKTYRQLYASHTDDTNDLEFYKTVPLEPPASPAAIPSINLGDSTTVDHSLWVALLARPGEEGQAASIRQEIAGKTLTLGIAPALEKAESTLRPSGPSPALATAALVFEIATGVLKAGQPDYETLDARLDKNPLEKLTLAQLTLSRAGRIGAWTNLGPLEEGVGDFPPSLEDDEVRKRVLTWIRIRLPKVETGPAASAPIGARISWVGINAARVSQQVQVEAEMLGHGTGEPDQSYRLMNRPVIAEAVELTVNGERWERTDDLSAAPPEVPALASPASAGTAPRDASRVFTADRQSGEVRFGDGLRGARPPRGAPIMAGYAYGGGRAGNVGIGAIKTSPLLPAGFKVSNPLPSRGGEEGESAADGEKNIPFYLRHRDRAVSVDDFRDIVLRTPGVELKRVEVLPAYEPVVGRPAPGSVTLLVIPSDAATPEAPEPDRLILDAVCKQLEGRRVVTTEVHVLGPDYVPLSVSIGIDVVAGKDIARVREDVKAAIRKFLSPLTGGPDEKGWPLEKPVEDRELLVAAARVDGVAKVRDVWMWDAKHARITTLDLKGLELPKLERIGASIGGPEDLLPPPPSGPPKKRLPVPVSPPGC